MAIVKMNKFMLLAFENQKKSLLEKLQSFQNVQFLDLSKNESSELKSDSASSEISEVEGELSKVKFIIELLSTFSEKPKLLKDLKEGKKSYSYDVLEQITSTSHWHEVYSDLKQKDNKINMNHNYITKLKANIEELKPWESLDTSVESINVLKKSKAILGEIPQGNVDSLRLKLEETTKNYYFEVISSIGRNSYIMVIAHNDDLADIEQLLKSSSFSKIDIQCDGVPKEVIKEYKKTIESINTENNFIQEGMKEHVNKLEEYKVVYEYYSSLLLRLKSTENFLKSKNIVAIEGYYPSELHNDFQSTLKSILGDDYYLESESAEGDDVPVKLKNNKVFESFENITSMYSVPKYKEIDPTPLLAPFYIFVGTLIALTTFNLDEDTRKSIKMFFLLSISTIFWGIMYGSYFGDFIKIAPLWMKPDSNVGLLMIVSVVMGLIQIYVGLGIKAYMQIRDKDYFGAFADVGLWYITLTGAIIWALSAFVDLASLGVPAVIIAIAKYGTIAGMVGIVLTNGRQESSIGGKLGQGFYALYGITSYVGDLVSYTRLAALGLATGFIAYAFNIMVSMVSTSWATIIFGIAIFVVGHVFNLFINALGAYVHTCRLQYLEYFGKFYEGGGTSFEPLKYNSKYFKISK